MYAIRLAWQASAVPPRIHHSSDCDREWYITTRGEAVTPPFPPPSLRATRSVDLQLVVAVAARPERCRVRILQRAAVVHFQVTGHLLTAALHPPAREPSDDLGRPFRVGASVVQKYRWNAARNAPLDLLVDPVRGRSRRLKLGAGVVLPKLAQQHLALPIRATTKVPQAPQLP